MLLWSRPMKNELIDFHSHILPKIDDGSGDVQTSLAMLRQEWEQGIGHVVLTPHFYPEHDSPERFLSQREKAACLLQEACAKEKDLPQLYLGAEVAYFRGMSESDALQQLCIDHTQYILVELPVSQWDGQIYAELAGIRQKQGLTPIVAHVDRYLPRFGAKRAVSRLLEQPVLIQANAASFLRRGSAGQMLKLLQWGMVHFLGSDCHDLTERAPNLGQAAELIGKKLGDHVMEQFNEMGQSVLQIPVSM